MTHSKPKRVLIFSTAYFPYVGGAEVAIKEITDRLSDEYEFDLICARYERSLPTQERIGAVNVYRLGWGIRILDKLFAPLLGALLARSLGRVHAYDAYWAMMVTYGSLGAYLANVLQPSSKVPVVLTLQEGDPPEYLRRKWFGLVGLSWKLALTRSQAVTVISRYLGALAREFGYRGEPVLIPNGVDTAHFGVLESFQKKNTDVRLVTTSRLVKKNGIDLVIRALKDLPQNVSFIVYGVGPDERMLKALAKELGVAARVTFAGQIGHQEMPAALRACDIFIRPSRSEGMGNSFIEAMAAGLPVIATQVGGIADFLFDSVKNPNKAPTGFAVETENPESIVEAVQRIQRDPEGVRRVIENARTLTHEIYDWDTIAKRMRAVFASLIKG